MSFLSSLNPTRWHPGCWTPAYFKNRIEAALFWKRHPDSPWLTQQAVNFLDGYLTAEDTVLEFGSGGSTVYFASRCKHVVSFESDRGWYDSTCRRLADRRLTNVDYRFCNDARYYESVREFQDAAFSVALIDGSYREQTALNSLAKLREGGIMIVDNVNRYIPCASTAPDTKRAFDMSSEEDRLWSRFCTETKTWRRFWSTNGVLDTLILFKPRTGR